MIHALPVFAAALLTHFCVQYHEPTAAQALSWAVFANVILSFYLTRATITGSAGIALLKVNSLYLTSLFTSIFIYRVFFHKLKSYPGPFFARVSKLWTCRIHLSGEYHRQIVKLHQVYGSIVRVAPNELAINDVEAIKLIYGTSSLCTKGPWYDGPASSGDARSVQSTRDPEVHRWRRRIWAPAFSVTAINEFQPQVTSHIELFLDQIGTHKELDIAEWCNFLTFDIMGDLTFGEPFNTLKNGKEHRFMMILHRFTKILSVLGAIPWLTSLISMLPVSGDMKEVEKFSKDCYNRRRARGSSRKDIFHYLLGEDKEAGTRLNEAELVIESRTAIVGGSDTTAIVLGSLFYYLVAHPAKYKRLQEEVDQQATSPANNQLTNLPYLNAIISESLRLMPPVPSGLQRVTPPNGMRLAGQWIPGNSFVSVSPYTVQRDPQNWGQPNEFIPERWIGEGPEPCNKDAWIPFSYGTYGCVGKQLALMELRHIVAAVVKRYDMHFATGFNVAAFERKMKDEFNMTPPRVQVVLENRF